MGRGKRERDIIRKRVTLQRLYILSQRYLERDKRASTDKKNSTRYPDYGTPVPTAKIILRQGVKGQR